MSKPHKKSIYSMHTSSNVSTCMHTHGDCSTQWCYCMHKLSAMVRMLRMVRVRDVAAIVASLAKHGSIFGNDYNKFFCQHCTVYPSCNLFCNDLCDQPIREALIY